MIAPPIVKPSRKLLILLFAAAFTLRIGYMQVRGTLGQSPSIERGYREYVMAGTRLLKHGTLVSPLIFEDVDHRPSALMPPVYAGLVAGVYGLLGVESWAATLALQLTNAAATSLITVLVCSFASTMAGRRAGLIAALVAGINPLLIGFTDFIWDTSLFTLGATIAVCWSYRLGNATPSLKSWFAFGGYLGALALLNPALSVAYPILVLWPLARKNAINWHSLVRPVLTSIAGWALLITPWTVRNYVQFDQLLYVRNGLGMELWLGACPEADAQGAPVFAARFPLNNSEVQRHVAEIGETAFVQECGDNAKKAILADPWRFVRLSSIRLIDYFLGTSYSHADARSESGRRFSIRQGISLFLTLEFISVVGLMIARRRQFGDAKWLLGICLVFGLVYCMTHAQIRFRAPIEPIVAVVIAVLSVGKRPEPYVIPHESSPF